MEPEQVERRFFQANVQENKMKSLMLGVAAGGLLMSSIGFAQTTQGASPAGTPPSAAAPSMSGSTPKAPAGSAGPATMDHSNSAAAASGNTNQAVATTTVNAATPAKGANSFTLGEAKSRLEKKGFSNVSDLAKDNNGVWRGSAQKDGSTTTVWLDYKGNTGEGR